MSYLKSQACAEHVRGWLQDQIGADALVYYSGSMPAKVGDVGMHFAITVPAREQDRLFLLRSITGPVLACREPVTVVLVVPGTAIEPRGRRARREATVYIKAGA